MSKMYGIKRMSFMILMLSLVSQLMCVIVMFLVIMDAEVCCMIIWILFILHKDLEIKLILNTDQTLIEEQMDTWDLVFVVRILQKFKRISHKMLLQHFLSVPLTWFVLCSKQICLKC